MEGMEGWLLLLILLMGIPLCLFPVAYVWHLNIGNLIARGNARGNRAKNKKNRVLNTADKVTKKHRAVSRI